MSEMNFGDRYAEASLGATNTVIEQRKPPTDKIVEGLSDAQIADLVEIYFAEHIPEVIWFKEAYRETDLAFSLKQNAAECRVLAALILEAAIQAGNAKAVLSVLTAGLAGARTPKDAIWLLKTAQEAQMQGALSGRVIPPLTANFGTAWPKMKEEIEALASGDWANLLVVLTKLNKETGDGQRGLANQIAAALRSADRSIRTMHEESQVLWWLFGEYSRTFSRPFSAYGQGALSILAGIELSDLTPVTSYGPLAAPAMLERVLRLGKPEAADGNLFKDFVDHYDREALTKLIQVGVPDRPFLFPVTTALTLARDFGSPVWHQPFEEKTGLSADLKLPAPAVAAQIYYERKLGSL